MLAAVDQVPKRHGDCLLAARHPQGADSAFQGGHPLFEHVGRGIHQPRVDPAHLLQGKQVGRVLRALETVAGRLVDGRCPGAGVRVGLLPGVQRQGSQAGEGGLMRVHGEIPLRVARRFYCDSGGLARLWRQARLFKGRENSICPAGGTYRLGAGRQPVRPASGQNGEF